MRFGSRFVMTSAVLACIAGVAGAAAGDCAWAKAPPATLEVTRAKDVRPGFVHALDRAQLTALARGDRGEAIRLATAAGDAGHPGAADLIQRASHP